MKGARLFVARRSAAAVTAAMLITAAFLLSLFSAVDARAQSSPGSCQGAADVAVLPAPAAPWQGAPLRVIFAAEKPIDGRAVADRARWQRRRQIARSARRAALFLVRRGRSTCRGDVARDAGDGRMRHDHARHHRARRGAAAAAGDAGRRLAGTRGVEPRDGESVFRMDPKAVRRAARRRSVVAGAA